MGISPGPDPSGRRRGAALLRPALALVVGLGMLVLVALPALGAGPRADQRFYLYEAEAIAGSNPLRLVGRTWEEIPRYLDLGTFRPVSRLGFYLEHWLTVRTAIATGLTPAALQGVVKVICLGAMLGVVLLTVDQYRRAGRVDARRARFRLVWPALAVTAATSMVLANPASHPLVLFPLGYLGATAVALAVPLLLGRSALQDAVPGRPSSPRWWVLGGFAVLGVLLAGMIELAYLAVPLGLAHLALLDVAAGGSGAGRGRRLAASLAFRRWLALTGGFLVVFIPVRILIGLRCAGRVCYEAVSISGGGDFFRALPLRAVSGLFGIPQVIHGPRVLTGASTPRFWVAATVAAVTAAVVMTVAIRGERATARPDDPLPPAGLGSAAAYFSVVVLLGALLSSLSQAVQDWGLVRLLGSWRDTGFAWAGWTGLLTVVAVVVLRLAAGRRWVVGLLVTAMAAAVWLTSVGNQEHLQTASAPPEAQLHLEVGRLVVDFETTGAGNAERCRVIEELQDLAPDAAERRKMDLLRSLLDATARNHYGVDFCVPG